MVGIEVTTNDEKGGKWWNPVFEGSWGEFKRRVTDEGKDEDKVFWWDSCCHQVWFFRWWGDGRGRKFKKISEIDESGLRICRRERTLLFKSLRNRRIRWKPHGYQQSEAKKVRGKWNKNFFKKSINEFPQIRPKSDKGSLYQTPQLFGNESLLNLTAPFPPG